MKKNLLIVISGILFFSCKKENTINLNTGFSEKIKNNIPLEIIEKFKEEGVSINEGQNPPKIEGIYLVNPLILTGTNLSSDFPIGYQFDDYKYKFFSQDNTELTIKVDYKSIPLKHPLENGTGIGGFIAGNGNSFTIFGEISGQISNIPYKMITVYSGEITNDGIKNFSEGFYMKDKIGDTSNSIAVGIGTIRTSKDGDGLASKIGNFRIRETPNLKTDKGCFICPFIE